MPGDVPDDVELPPLFATLSARFPWSEATQAVTSQLATATPALATTLTEFNHHIFGRASGFFYLPAAMSVEWGTEDEAWIRQLLEISAVGHAHFAFHDALIDTGEVTPEFCLFSDLCLLSYLDRLDQWAPRTDRHRYRTLHDRYYGWYVEALAIELRHRRELTHFTSHEVLASGMRAAPGNTLLHLVADRAGRSDRADSLVRTVMHLCAGLQVLDDLDDLAEDYEHGNYSMPLTELLIKRRVDDSVVAEDLIVEAAVSGTLQAGLAVAGSLFSLARRSGDEAGSQALSGLVESWLRRTERRKALLASAVTGP